MSEDHRSKRKGQTYGIREREILLVAAERTSYGEIRKEKQSIQQRYELRKVKSAMINIISTKLGSLVHLDEPVYEILYLCLVNSRTERKTESEFNKIK